MKTFTTLLFGFILALPLVGVANTSDAKDNSSENCPLMSSTNLLDKQDTHSYVERILTGAEQDSSKKKSSSQTVTQ